MRRAVRFGLAASIGLTVTSGAFGQTTGTSTGTTSSSAATSSTGGGSSGLTTSTPGLSSSTALTGPATITGVSIGESTGTRALDTSNVLGGYYANPFYQGSSGATENTPPGGFGTALYSSSGSTGTGGVATGSARTVGGGSTGRATAGNTGGLGGTTGGTTGTRTGGMTGLGGTTGTRGGATGLGGGNRQSGASSLGGSTSQTIPNLLTTTNSNFAASAQGGQIVPLPRAISYLAVMRFPVATIPPAAVQSNLQSILDSSTQMSSSRGVQVVAETGGAVVLRGVVKDEDEARLAEGMVRLTPGVRDVRNELTYPTSNSTP